MEQLPERLPVELTAAVKMDRQRGLLGVSGKMSMEQRNRLLPLFASPHDQECVERLYWLSNHTHAPEVWQPDTVRALMTRNYTERLVNASFSPLNIWDDVLYWTTAYNRSDQMAKIFTQNLFGAKLLAVPKFVTPSLTCSSWATWIGRPKRRIQTPGHPRRVTRLSAGRNHRRFRLPSAWIGFPAIPRRSRRRSSSPATW